MSDDYAEFIARRPRHRANAEIAVEVARADGAEPPNVQAAMLDVSREGFCLRTPLELEIGETITVRLWDADSGFDLTLPGTVRWQRPDDDGIWTVGCQSPEPLDWETLGELFLNELLAAE
jgi:hypothetical protein